ncbi:MAG: clostripain-related cysteine peptidase [Alistipes onderdonkii]
MAPGGRLQNPSRASHSGLGEPVWAASSAQGTRSLGWDDGVGEDAPGSMPHAEMELEEFAAAIPDGQLDFIVFEACLMAGVEVAYVLRGKTDYILSSAAEIVSPGFTPIYPSALRYLFDTSRSVEASLAAFGESYMSHVNKLSGDSRSATLSLVATKELDLLAARTRELLAGLSHRPDIISDLQHFDRPGSYGRFPGRSALFRFGRLGPANWGTGAIYRFRGAVETHSENEGEYRAFPALAKRFRDPESFGSYDLCRTIRAACFECILPHDGVV